MDEEERIIIIQTMLDNNGIEEGEFAEYEKEALQSLLDSYKFQRKQLNDAFDKGFIHKDKIKEKLESKIDELRKICNTSTDNIEKVISKDMAVFIKLVEKDLLEEKSNV